jgi:hypothetical protein
MSRTDAVTARPKSWAKGPHDILLGFLALVLCYVPALVFGIGASPCFLFAGALFIAVLASQIAKRSERPVRVELIALAVVITLSSIFSYWAAHPGPRRLFRMAFGVEPPAGVTDLRGRVQWFDGQTVLLRFNADEATLKEVMNSRKFVPDELMRWRDADSRSTAMDYVKRHFNTAHIADRTWIDTVQFDVPKLWKWQVISSSGTAEETVVLVNEKNEVWVMYFWT